VTTLISVGNVVVDILARVPALPERGGDVLATASGMSPGGSFNAMVSAVRQGLPAAYAGGHGTGFFGDLVRAGLRESGIDVLLAPLENEDSGYDIAVIDDGGERTFITSFGAEAHVSAEALAAVVVDPEDFVHVSGYGLLDATNGAVLAPWLAGLDSRVRVLLDPGPLVADIRPPVWAVALARANWLSCNEREATLLTGATDATAAIRELATLSPGVVVRLGAGGCLVATAGEVRSVAGFDTTVVDTNGAGDAHSGAFLAALAAGLSPIAAAVRANACAAISVGRFGPATAPTLAETIELVESADRGEEA
jgi:sugar/nucleoside kinase (ribokinase family)